MKIDREYTLGIGGTILPLPCFFPSISCIKTNLPPIEYLRLITAIKYPLFLISAYDIHHASTEDRSVIDDLLQRSVSDNRIVLLDSGNYESYWRNDKTWLVEGFAKVYSSVSFHIAFCYDNQNPSDNADEIVEDVIRSVLRSQKSTLTGAIVPIVHGQRQLLPDVSSQLAEQLRPILLAIPERVLGEGVFQRAETVYKIRSALNNLDYYCPLHLLGTGDPLSILVYSACGADSFDGLEWCRTSVDYSSGQLFCFHHWDFFTDQSGIKHYDLPYDQTVFVHNLIFYERWLKKVGVAIKEGRVTDLAASYLPNRAVEQLRLRISEIF